MKSKWRPWTTEQKEWLRRHYPEMSRKELLAEFNRVFNETRKFTAMVGCLKNHKITSGRSGRFEPGHVPWTKGKKGVTGPNSGSFKPGHLPHNHKPLWSERVNRDGYIEISVPEKNPYTGSPTRYKPKHVWIWEQAHGPRPKGHVVIFLDGDNRNFSLDNLGLVSQSVLLHLNQHNYKEAPAELKPAILALAKLEAKAGFRTDKNAPRPRRRKETADEHRQKNQS